MNREPIVYIVDDDPAYSESMSVLLISIGLKSKCFSSGLDYLNQFDSQAPGVLLLDVRMPNISGLSLQERLSKEPLCVPIIILTGHADVPTAIRAMQRGAAGFFQKTLSEMELCDAIQKAVAEDAKHRAEHAKHAKILARMDRLTPAEKQVLELILVGRPNKTIASNLGVSRRAVEDRRSRIMQKLEVDSLPELVRLASDAGMGPQE
ncbi:MAG TPA: response regulator [Pirellulales bacterium]|jgi:FixJ family two-component response regulator|nr:response regulator [Pirellulales bacterium]